ncbi:heme peroxidase family protein [Promicromonospora sp. MEB111]|uniref:peroxidase family protein n=1 Tax=Promicromonospora sp. MEB111 TaxID=3040301 RepID=UPI00254CF2FF|nr:heme peroxidase family protein [Promicromonospora sp. MEB111]
MVQPTQAPPQGDPNHSPHEAVDLAQTPAGRTVRRIGHGGVFVPADPDAPEDPRDSTATLMPRTEAAVRRDLREHRFDATTSFDYLLRDLAREFPDAHLPVGDRVAGTRDALMRLGAGMIEAPAPAPAPAPGAPPAPAAPPRDSTIPSIYTYWGQFIDHDITLNTNGPDDDSGPRGDQALGDIVNDPFRVFTPDVVRRSLHNGRVPLLDLDSLYGSGPRFAGEKDRGTTRSEAAYVPDSAKLRLGRIGTEPFGPFSLVAPGDDPQRDLPRSTEAGSERMPLIPDSRNDENLIVAQFHVAMIRFHNAVVDWVAEHEPWSATTQRELFDRAQQLVRFHYQWLVVNDYLRTLTKPGVLDSVLATGPTLFRPARRVSMPLEFAVAAFRFGHSMVRGAYDFNVNFTGNGPGGVARLDQLFQFTGNGGLSPNPANPSPVLPSNWPVEWPRLTDKGDPLAFRMARKIDPFLADGLGHLLNEGNTAAEPIKALLKQLAQRNLLRGYMLAIPTGEAVAKELRARPLTPTQLRQNASPEVVAALDALDGTPLWYYVLKEAEVQGNGNFLGEVGSRILAETFVYLLRLDDESFLRRPGRDWTPAYGVRFEDRRLITTISDLLAFAGVFPIGQDDAGLPLFRRNGDGYAGHDGA